jgi:hypothetical protein
MLAVDLVDSSLKSDCVAVVDDAVVVMFLMIL